MLRRWIVRVGSALAITSLMAACAQLQGLDAFEKVDCLDDCANGNDSGADVGTTNPMDTSTSDAPLLTDTSIPPIDAPNDASTDDADADAGPLVCTGDTANCGGTTCVDLRTTKEHCGSCPNACPGANECCAKVCVDQSSDKNNCGGCNLLCTASEVCTASKCDVAVLGVGADGPLAVNADTTINTTRSGGLGGAAGQRVLDVVDAGFAINDVVIVHQTRGVGAGTFEIGTIESVSAGTSKITLVRNLKNTYSSAGDNRAQIVRVPQYTTVSIAAGATLRAPAWDGTSGGILAFKATGAVTVNGTIDMNARGYRGFSHAGDCTNLGKKYVCTAADTANGFAGESGAASSSATVTANGAGGGGGQDGQDCGSGGGGGYGSGGIKGGDGNGLICHVGAQLGGSGGLVAGSSDLNVSLLFGGAGGEGGGDEDGAYPGRGGNGGGIIWIDASAITITGVIQSNGEIGADGVINDAACGGSGCGMGPGGGGAGGAIHLRTTTTATLGANLVTATGKGGGNCTCGPAGGGVAGDGRIGVAGAASGTTTPTFAAQ